jgi:sugar phosphate isomerase/epimerase
MSLERLSINQATLKYAPLSEVIAIARQIGAPAIGVWRETVGELGADTVAGMLADAGLRASSLCRGGFFTASDDSEWGEALDENRRAIVEAATIGAPALVLVAGGLPSGTRDLVGARNRVRDAVGALAEFAESAGVVLAVEALHPMYAADRAVVSTLAQALDIAEQFSASQVGVVVDTFHLWWDPDLQRSIERAGRGHRIQSYQVCDWLIPIAADPLLSRGYPGDGCIDFSALTSMVVDAAYCGDIEVEIMNQAIWDDDWTAVARVAAERYVRLIEPNLCV